MDAKLANEIIQCLPRDRTLFRYYKGRFANLLLAMVSDRYATVRALKDSPFQSLTARPEVKSVLASRGDGKVCARQFEQAWQEPSLCFRLTISRWEGKPGLWGQTSRQGVNLVLQLNFSNQHNAEYRRLYKPEIDNVFNYGGHPIADGEEGDALEETLAWSRIDLDFGDNEALIEEVQSDWVRKAKRYLLHLEHAKRSGRRAYIKFSDASRTDRIKYRTEVLPTYTVLWQEVILAATIWFIRRELGITNVFTHTAESGSKVKRITGDGPPISLYSKLPKKFCFQQGKEAPAMIAETQRYRRLAKKVPLKWNRLVL
ncbi:MAG: hypothetical protein AAF387_20855 [Pseudomonadota bacterium]